MRLSYRSAIIFSGLLWLAIGILLLSKGLSYLVVAGSAHLEGTLQGFSLLTQIDRFVKNPEKSAIVLVSVGLVLGFFKGRMVMKKAVNRVVKRIHSFPSPLPVTAIYSKGYLCLIGGMTLMGISLKFLPIPIDVKGFMDFTVGTALINGAMLYFRAAFEPVHKVA
ncbi:MAG: hypothetical protein KFB95_04310 [Simkaniaceae bacterium]|nr:MAG: hypothetical protein KFB95_04310 [Simkaniaceae bacterium]